MPKNNSADRLRLWIDLDQQLSHGGLLVGVTARQFKVSKRTIHRDLDVFRELGQKIVLWKGSLPLLDAGEHLYLYVKGVRPLFACNLDRS